MFHWHNQDFVISLLVRRKNERINNFLLFCTRLPTLLQKLSCTICITEYIIYCILFHYWYNSYPYIDVLRTPITPCENTHMLHVTYTTRTYIHQFNRVFAGECYYHTYSETGSCYIAYFYCACAKGPYFHFRSKIWHHHRVPWPRFPIRRRNFGNSAINKGYIAYFSFLLRMLETAIFPLPIWGRFQLTFSSEKWKVRHISAFGLFGLLSRPRWSFPPSLKLIQLSITELQRCWCGYVTWPCDLDLLSLDSGQTWLVTWSTPPPSLKILRLSVLDSWVMMSAIGHR